MPASSLTVVSEPLSKPLLRGVLHEMGFAVSLVVGTLLIVGVEGTRRQVAAAVFAGSVAACFGASALYHRVTWTPRLRPWLRRVDHAGVYLLIAGTYTPICLLVLGSAWRLTVLAVVWVCAGVAIAFKFAWVDAPKWLAVAIGLSLGWGGLVVLPQLVVRLNPAAVVLLGVGGLAYTLGAIIYVQTTGPGAVHLRLSRALSRADDRRGCMPVRCDCVLRRPRRLGADACRISTCPALGVVTNSLHPEIVTKTKPG